MLLLLCALLAGEVISQDQPPPSPCPDVFQYTFDKGQWSGHIVVVIPDQAKRLVVVASMFVTDVILPPEHPGDLHLIHDAHVVKQKILQRQTNTVEYGLVFPTQSPIPIVDKIKVNRKVICQGPRVEAKIRKKVSFTHRLNGLRTSPANKQSDPKQGRILDKAEKHREFNGGKDTVGNKDKYASKNVIELLDNEVYQEEVSKEKYVPNYKNQGQNFNTGLNGKDLKNLFQNEFDFNEDAEVLDNEIFQEDRPEVEHNPDYKSKGPGFNTEFPDGKNQKDLPGSEFDPKEDVEMLDNEIPQEDSIEVEDNSKHNSIEPVFNTEFRDGKNQKDLPGSEFDPKEDVEMLDNEIPQEDSIEVEDNSKHNSIGPGFNTEFRDGKNQKDFPGSEFDPKEDIEMLDNEIPQEDSIEVEDNPKHNSKEPGFNPGFYHDTDDEDLP